MLLLRCIEPHALLPERALEVITSEQVIKNIALGSRVFERGGLYLIAAKTSTRLHGWRFDDTFEGKRERLGIAETRLRTGPGLALGIFASPTHHVI